MWIVCMLMITLAIANAQYCVVEPVGVDDQIGISAALSNSSCVDGIVLRSGRTYKTSGALLFTLNDRGSSSFTIKSSDDNEPATIWTPSTKFANIDMRSLSNSLLRFQNIKFVRDVSFSAYYGGIMEIHLEGPLPSLDIQNCSFHSSNANYGSALYITLDPSVTGAYQSPPSISLRNTVFMDNYSPGETSAIQISTWEKNPSNPSKCRNSFRATVSIDNCIFSHNMAAKAYAVHVNGGSNYVQVSVTDSIFDANANQTITGTPDMACSTTSSINVVNSTFCNTPFPFGTFVNQINTSSYTSADDTDGDNVADSCDYCPYDPSMQLRTSTEVCGGMIDTTNSYGSCPVSVTQGQTVVCNVTMLDSLGNAAYQPGTIGVGSSSASLQGNSLPITTTHINKTTIYQISFTPTESGEATVTFKYYDAFIGHQSTATVTVMPSSGSATSLSIPMCLVMFVLANILR